MPIHDIRYGRTETGLFYEVRSEDFGRTWSAPVQSPVRAPVAPPYLRKIPNTPYIVLIWNPYDPSVKRQRRAILASQISRDGGITWENYKQIEYTGKETFDYPFILFDDDSIHLAYRVRNSIGYRKLPRDWFTR
jgi:predicted neuraminidase